MSATKGGVLFSCKERMGGGDLLGRCGKGAKVDEQYVVYGPFRSDGK